MDQVSQELSTLPEDQLTPRELEILALLVKRLSDREIAEALFIEVTTVKWYNRQIYSKLGTKNRREAVARAEALGLLVTASSLPSTLNQKLPADLTPFIGRERELEELAALIAQSAVRLITILGPGGMGKTRLALKTAEGQHNNFTDGVYFIPLTAPCSGEYVFATIAESIGFHLPLGSNPKQQLLNYLRAKQMLLVLDNFENLLESAEIVSEILRDAPNIKILATSREKLNLNGELLYRVSGLDFPDTDHPKNARAYGSVELFIQHARHMRPTFEPTSEDLDQIAHICRFVHGMPLGIVLAAAWVGVLSPGEIAEEITCNLDFLMVDMRDAPQQHQHSLRAVFDYSWNRLSSAERTVFARLSVFRGGFTRDAAHQIARANLSILHTLVNKALLWRTPAGRFNIHEILRQFAEDRLWESTEANEVVDAHCAHFAEFMRQQQAELRGKRQLETLRGIEDELENVRAAWNRSLAQQDSTALTILLQALARFYEMRSWFQEGEAVFGQAVEQFVGDGDATLEQQLVLGKLLARQGSFAHRLGQYRRAEQFLQISLLIFRREAVDDEMAFAMTSLADVARAFGLFNESIQYCQKSLKILRERSDQWGIAANLNNLGVATYHLERYDEARDHFEECLTISRALSDQFGIVMSLNNLGVLAHDLGDYQDAERLYHRSLAISKTLDDQYGIAASLINLGRVAYLVGENESAQQRGQEGLRISRGLGNQWGIAASLINLGDIACAQKDFMQARSYFGEALQITAGIGADPLTVEIIGGMAALIAAEGQTGLALELLAWLQSHPPTDREIRDRADHLRAALIASVPPDTAHEAQATGQQRELSDIIEQLFRLV